MTGLLRDLRQALRRIWRQPGFALVVILMLGGAIGFGTSVFTVFNGIAYTPWSVKDPDRVVRIRVRERHTLAEWRLLTEQARLVSGIVAESDADLSRVRLSDQNVRGVHYQVVSANYFEVLGIPMEQGRAFLEGDDRPGVAGATGVISHELWKKAFAGDPSIVGRRIRWQEGTSLTIVGVASRNFPGTLYFVPTDVWLPLGAKSALRISPAADLIDLKSRSFCRQMAARLGPGVSMRQAEAELATLSGHIRSQHGLAPDRLSLKGTAMFSSDSPDPRQILILATVSFCALLVLLLACGNAGNLFLARGFARRQELAVRLSLGATRARLVRPMLAEAFLLACVAGVLGLTIAARLPDPLFRWWTTIPSTHFPVDQRVLLYSLGLVAVACLTFGLVPALHTARASVDTVLKNGGGMPKLLLDMLKVQVAASVVLVMAASLLVRGLQGALVKPLGFRTEGVSVVSLELPPGYDDSRESSFAKEIRPEIDRLAQSGALAVTGTVPLEGKGATPPFTSFRVPGVPRVGGFAGFQQVSAGYFEILRLAIVAGRNFGPAEPPGKVVLVSESLARRAWPGQTAVGNRLTLRDSPREVIGVVRDAYVFSLDKIEPVIYEPMAPGSLPKFLVRGHDTGSLQALAAIAARIDPAVRMRVQPLSAVASESLSVSRRGATVVAGVAGLGLAIAVLGLAGVFGFAVQQRTREIGIRVAVGARPAQVFRAVLGPTLRALIGGLLAGGLGALGAAQLLRRFLYGLSPLDPVAYGWVALVLALAAIAAASVPARRAMRVDPAEALRHE